MGVARLKSGGTLKSVVTRHESGAILAVFHAFSGSPTAHRPPPTAAKPPGLGDLVATLAGPIAELIDTISERLLSEEHKTALATCGGCARRQRKLNLLCPDLLTCPFLGTLLGLLPKPVRRAVMEAATARAKPPTPA